ncbi:hypothetical protein BDZ45DRAFT_692050 [Acephala macrosclerotiorum]|nr:hypothetical protein BDZ45DRAFT_692050 [Acephala macrosclerotiorum]
MRILGALFSLLLSMAQLASPKESGKGRDFKEKLIKKYKGMRDPRYGTFAVHYQTGCALDTMIQQDMYEGCMNILDIDNGKSFYWRASNFHHLVYGHLVPDCEGDPIRLTAGEACLPIDLADMDSSEHWYKNGLSEDTRAPDLNWEGKMKSVKFVKTYLFAKQLMESLIDRSGARIPCAVARTIGRGKQGTLETQ